MGVPEGDRLGVAVCVDDGLGLGLAVGVGLAVLLGERVGLKLGLGEMVGVGVFQVVMKVMSSRFRKPLPWLPLSLMVTELMACRSMALSPARGPERQGPGAANPLGLQMGL